MASTSSAAGHSVALQIHSQVHEGFTPKVYQHVALRAFSHKCEALSIHTCPANFRRRSQAVAATTQEATKEVSVATLKKFHFVVANAKFMLDEEEHLQELMRERLRLFGDRKKEQDFWLVIEPQFLERFPEITKRLGRPAVALVSTDELWIRFMRLRLDRVLKGEFEAESLAQALPSNPTELSFEKPPVWTAPYPKYEGSWWAPFLPPLEG
ncbi:hypothetical protein KP509_35G026800 [Ceratopteris richardii]|uniref:Uncharacterized protein n=1 Tax=Ceratopteris richardii TaxID=49495 RepID=A0A8T2QF76_CERRI|nr:hypothetical protein KP509_35G026800 [Ceratopteris richardii]